MIALGLRRPSRPRPGSWAKLSTIFPPRN